MTLLSLLMERARWERSFWSREVIAIVDGERVREAGLFV